MATPSSNGWRQYAVVAALIACAIVVFDLIRPRLSPPDDPYADRTVEIFGDMMLLCVSLVLASFGLHAKKPAFRMMALAAFVLPCALIVAAMIQHHSK